MQPARLPPRRRVCLGCRTLLPAGQTCGARHGHEPVALDEPSQRARLDDEVWGPDSRARQLRRAAKAGAGGGLFGGTLQGCNACDVIGFADCGELAGAGEGIVAVLLALVAAVVFALVAATVVWLVVGLVSLIRERLERPKPHGALRRPPKASGRAHGSGTVAGDARLALPWSSGEALGYALELHTKAAFGGDALLRDAMAAGFDVTLDDGRRVRVPPGRVTLLGALPPAEIDRARVDAFLGDIDPKQGERPLFPYDHARAAAIHPGDRVDVLGDLETSADGSEGHGYRASAGLLVPVGIPVLRIKRRADDDAHYRVANDAGGGVAEARAQAAAEPGADPEAHADPPSSAGGARAQR